MRDEVLELVKAIFTDARMTWPQLTIEYMVAEAESQLAGNQPRGGPGVFLNDYLKKGGFIG